MAGRPTANNESSSVTWLRPGEGGEDPLTQLPIRSKGCISITNLKKKKSSFP